MFEYDPKKQFSKWLARWTSIFWFAYMLILAVILIIQPVAADAALYLGITVSVVMIAHVWAYTRNSIYEKALRAGAEFGKHGIKWKTSENKNEEEEEDAYADNG